MNNNIIQQVHQLYSFNYYSLEKMESWIKYGSNLGIVESCNFYDWFWNSDKR